MSRRGVKINKRFLTVSGIILVVVLLGFGLTRLLQYRKDNATCTTDCNVILISVDSVRADHLSSFGYYRSTSPNFDKLAKRGTLFKNYYSSSFLTPIAEASVHTGLYPTSNGVTNFYNALPQDRTTLAQYMKKLGYHTQAVIASPEFIAYKELKSSFQRGFDSYVDSNRNANSLAGSRKYPPIKDISNILKNDQQADKNTFLWLPLGGVHWPYGELAPDVWTNPSYSGKLANSDLSVNLFMNLYDKYVYPSKTEKVALNDEDLQYIVDNYDDGIRAFDDYLGNILDQLKKYKLDKKTIIVIQSEHGEALGERGYYAHYDIQDSQVHVPLLIVDPRIKGGKQVSSLASSVDVLPTILNLVGTSTGSATQGKSLAPILKGTEKDGERNEIYIERVPLWEEAVLLPGQSTGILAADSGAKDIAIRTDKWKYILRLANKREEEISVWAKLTGIPAKIPPAELYDLKNDPKEAKNVVDQNPEVAAQLKKQLTDWYAEVQAAAPKDVKKTNVLQPYQ